MKNSISQQVLGALLMLSFGGMAQADSDQDKITRALSAAPPSIGAQATVVDMGGRVLRQGSNGWTCMPSVTPNDKIPMCNDAAWMSFMNAFMKGQKVNVDRVGVSYMLQGDIPTNNDDPFDTTRDPGEPWVEEGPHIMILAPNLSSLEGLSSDPGNGGPYVMWGGTPYAHIMVPVPTGDTASARPSPLVKSFIGK